MHLSLHPLPSEGRGTGGGAKTKSMKPTIFFTFVLILLLNHAISGTDYYTVYRDSLKAVINDKSLADTTRLHTTAFLARSYDYIMPDSMLYYARILREESVKANYPDGIASSFIDEGYYYEETGQNNEAMRCYLAAIKPAEESGHLRTIGFVYGAVGTGYSKILMMDKAIEFLLKSIKIFRELNDPKSEVAGLINLTSVYVNIGNDPKALEIELRMISMVDSLKLSPGLKASALDGLGSIYKRAGKYAEAIKAYNEALKLHQETQNLLFYRITLFNMADFFLGDTLSLYGKEIGDNRKSADIALTCLDELELICRNIGDSSMLSLCYVMSAEAFLQKGETNLALEKAREAESLKFKDNDLNSQIDYTTRIAKIYSICGEYKKAAGYYLESIALMDSLDRVKMAEKVRQLNESYEVKQVQNQLSQKEQQLAKSRLITYLFVALSALILILAFIVSYFLRQKQKATKLLEHQNREIEKARSHAEQSEKFKERFLASMSHESARR